MDKRWENAAAAVADVPDGATIMVGGFSLPGRRARSSRRWPITARGT